MKTKMMIFALLFAVLFSVSSEAEVFRMKFIITYNTELFTEGDIIAGIEKDDQVNLLFKSENKGVLLSMNNKNNMGTLAIINSKTGKVIEVYDIEYIRISNNSILVTDMRSFKVFSIKILE